MIITAIVVISFATYLFLKYFTTIFGEQPYDDDIPYPLENKGKK